MSSFKSGGTPCKTASRAEPHNDNEVVDTRWFAAPHTGSDDDRTALEGLHEELSAAL